MPTLLGDCVTRKLLSVRGKWACYNGNRVCYLFVTRRVGSNTCHIGLKNGASHYLD
jgi:hypothetical protein